MNDQLQKRDAGKFDPLMIEEDLGRSLAVCNAVLEFGKEKYGTRGGWKAVDIGRYRSAGARHRREVMLNGIADKDAETNLLHKAHEVINGLFEIEMYLKGKKLAPYLDYRKPVPVAPVKQEQQFQNVPSDADAHSRQCPITSVVCHACPPGETCRAQYTGSRAPDWVKDQIQPTYHTPINSSDILAMPAAYPPATSPKGRFG